MTDEVFKIADTDGVHYHYSIVAPTRSMWWLRRLLLLAHYRIIIPPVQNGTIDMDEFKKGFINHPDICAFFKQF